MSLTSRDTGGEGQEPVTQGMHHAIAVGLWDCGTQINQTFQTAMLEIVFMWEVPGELHTFKDKDSQQDISRPKVITRRFTNSLSSKAHLRAILETWRGKPFTELELNGFLLSAVIKANCFIQVMHKPTKRGGMFPEVTAVMPLTPGHPKLEPVRPTTIFDMDKDKVIPEFTPNWIKNKILQSPEWAQVSGTVAPGQQPGMPGEPPPVDYDQTPPGNYDDDIPF